MSNTVPQNQKRPFIGRLAGFIALFLGLVILGFGILAPWIQGLERSKWQRWDCEITAASVVEEIREETWGNGTREVTWYIPTVEYNYFVPKPEVESPTAPSPKSGVGVLALLVKKSSTIAEPAPAFRDPKAAQYIIDQYPVDSPNVCFEDPNDTSQVYLEIAPANPARIPIFICGCIFTLMGILGLSGRASQVGHATSSALAE